MGVVTAVNGSFETKGLCCLEYDPYLFINEVIIESADPPSQFGAKGDSGAPVVSLSREPLGLYWGRSFDGAIYVACPIPAVLQALGVQIY
jgi:hypothetical protein